MPNMPPKPDTDKPEELTSCHPLVSFGDHRLSIVEMGGRIYMIAKEVGQSLGYGSEGGRLATMVTHEWAAEMKEGIHWLMLTGERLAEVILILRKTEDQNGAGWSKARRLLLLTEQGLYRVLMLAGGPVACRFRDWLDSEVLPQLRKTGTYTLPGAGAPPSLPPPPPPKALPGRGVPSLEEDLKARLIGRTGATMLWLSMADVAEVFALAERKSVSMARA